LMPFTSDVIATALVVGKFDRCWKSLKRPKLKP
jgi:hypothetical protein